MNNRKSRLRNIVLVIVIIAICSAITIIIVNEIIAMRGGTRVEGVRLLQIEVFSTIGGTAICGIAYAIICLIKRLIEKRGK